MNKTILAIGLSTALGAATSAQADINFDRDGSGGGSNVIQTSSLTWNPANLLFEDLIQGGDALFTLYGHASLASFNPGNEGPIAGTEFTYAFSVPMVAVAGAAAGSWSFNAFGAGSFEIFADDGTGIASDNNTGAGFSDGKLILGGDFIPDPATAAAGFLIVVPAAAPKPALDGFGQTDNFPGITTDTLIGALNFRVDATYADADYFLTNVVDDILMIGYDLAQLEGIAAPFTTVDPSTIVGGVSTEVATVNSNVGEFWGVAGAPTVKTDEMANFGDSINDNACTTSGFPCDVQAQSPSGSTAFTAELVPTPTTLALLGGGLFALGATGARRRRQS